MDIKLPFLHLHRLYQCLNRIQAQSLLESWFFINYGYCGRPKSPSGPLSIAQKVLSRLRER